MNECIFCKIVVGSMPSYKVYENDTTLSFVDIFGATDGHVMVIHKNHGDTVLNYSGDELQEIWVTAQKVASALEKAYNTNILSIGINHGEPKGVRHLHVHIMPRYDGDGGGIIQSLPGKPLSNKDFTAVAGKISKYIKK
jgi:histidine triad (HIT) family protein